MTEQMIKYLLDSGVMALLLAVVVYGVYKMLAFIAPLVKEYFTVLVTTQQTNSETLKQLGELHIITNERLAAIEHQLSLLTGKEGL